MLLWQCGTLLKLLTGTPGEQWGQCREAKLGNELFCLLASDDILLDEKEGCDNFLMLFKCSER